MQLSRTKAASKAQTQLHHLLVEFPWLWGIRQEWHHELIEVTVHTFHDRYDKPKLEAISREVVELLRSRHDDTVEIWVMSATKEGAHHEGSHHIIHAPTNPEITRASACVKCLPWCGGLRYLIAVKKDLGRTSVVIYRSPKKDAGRIGMIARCIDCS